MQPVDFPPLGTTGPVVPPHTPLVASPHRPSPSPAPTKASYILEEREAKMMHINHLQHTLLLIVPPLRAHQVLVYIICEKYYYESLGKVPWEPWAKSHGSVGQSWLKDPTAQRDLLYQFTVALLDEMRQGYLRSLELSSLPGLDINKTMLTGNWPLRLEASLQLHITTKGGLLGNAASQASVSTRPTIPYEPRVYIDSLPTALQDFVAGNDEYPRLLKESLRAPETLMQNYHGMSVTPAAGVDFGLRRCEPLGNLLSRGNNDEYAMAAAAAKAPTFYRQVTIRNTAMRGWLLLLGLHSQPAWRPTLRLVDDLGYAEACMERLDTASPSAMDRAVWIPPGGAYHLTVQLRCIPQQQGVLSQWLLFVCCRCVQRGDRWTPQDVFFVGRQVMASVTLNPDDVKYTLSFAAKPFIPTRLRQLFDSPPAQADRVFKGPSPSSLFLQPNWRDAENHETLLPVFRVLERIDTANAAAFLLPEGEQIATQFQIQPLDRHHASRSMRDPSGVRITAMKQHTEALKLWRRLLRLEANAQARDITRYDIFNTHLEQYKVVDGHTWLKVLVPGLPESRPPVFVGDVLHIRLQGPEADKLEHSLELVVAVFAVAVSDAAVYVVLPSLLPELRPPLLVHVRFECETRFFSRALTALQRAASCPFPLLPLPDLRAFYPGEPPEALSDSTGVCEKPSDGWPISRTLNTEQRQAVEAVLDGKARGGCFVLFGPPGTGKTMTVAETIAQVLRAQPRAHILVCAPAPFAADVLTSKLVTQHGLNAKQLVRINDPRRDEKSVKEDVRPFCSREELRAPIFRLPVRSDLDALNVWVCSCASAALLYEAPDTWRSHVRPFTHIFLDEAGQATVPESLIPLSFAQDPNCSVVLAGDPFQLGPVVHSSQAAASGLGASLLEMFMTHREKQAAAEEGIVQLTRNYRSHQDLLDLPSQLFYRGVLRAACDPEDVALPGTISESFDLGDGVRTIFYGVSGEQQQEADAPSYFNAQECNLLVETIEFFLSEPAFGLGAGDIGVMATYRKQVQKIRNLLRLKKLGAVRVGTVDDYQGQEERIIFISTVLTQRATVQCSDDHVDPNLAFLTSPQRFNVATSRAKVLNVVFGHPAVLLECKPWCELLRRCLGRGAYRGYGSQHVRNALSGKRSAYESVPEDEVGDTEVGEADDVWGELAQLAKTALLGGGYAQQMYEGQTFDSGYSEEQEWRVAL